MVDSVRRLDRHYDDCIQCIAQRHAIQTGFYSTANYLCDCSLIIECQFEAAGNSFVGSGLDRSRNDLCYPMLAANALNATPK